MLAFCDLVTSFILQSTVFPHGDDTTLIVLLGFRAIGTTSDVDQVVRCSGVEDWGPSMKLGQVKARKVGVPARLASTGGCRLGWGESSA